MEGMRTIQLCYFIQKLHPPSMYHLPVQPWKILTPPLLAITPVLGCMHISQLDVSIKHFFYYINLYKLEGLVDQNSSVCKIHTRYLGL